MPFSNGLLVGNTLYVAGEQGADANGKLVPGGIGPETRATLETIQKVVREAGFQATQCGTRCTCPLYPLLLQIAQPSAQVLLLLVRRQRELLELHTDVLQRTACFALEDVLLLAFSLTRLKYHITRGAKLLPQRMLVALCQHQFLRLCLPLGLDSLDMRRRIALIGCTS